MSALLFYLVKLSCALSLIWLFYRLALHNLTFYSLNRWYLLGYTFLSFLVPLIDIGPIRGEDRALQPMIIRYIPVIGRPALPATPAITVASRTAHWDMWTLLLLLLSLGSCLLLVRFLVRCYSLRKLQRRAVLLQKGPINIYRVQEPISPFSFGNAIYVSSGEHSGREWEELILHEYVHIRERHSIDILLGELLVIVNWYNPFAWLIRYSIRQNLEFIADRAVIDNGFDKKGYQYHLLKVVGQTRYQLANNFNYSSLKKRIIMMNKLGSARLHLIRFLFILPLLAVLLVAFRKTGRPAVSTPIVRTPIVSTPFVRTIVSHPVDTAPRDPDTAHPIKITTRRTNPHFQKARWIVDGVLKPQGWYDLDSVNKLDIAAMYIYSSREAIPIFGDKGVNGVVLIVTKTHQPNMPIIVTNSPNNDDPAYVVDGNLVDHSPLDSLNPNDIESISVLKNETAQTFFGEKGRNGVIAITTKKAHHPEVILETKDANGKPLTMAADTIQTPEGKIYHPK